jgi:hypothetical protein
MHIMERTKSVYIVTRFDSNETTRTTLISANP